MKIYNPFYPTQTIHKTYGIQSKISSIITFYPKFPKRKLKPKAKTYSTKTALFFTTNFF